MDFTGRRWENLWLISLLFYNSMSARNVFNDQNVLDSMEVEKYFAFWLRIVLLSLSSRNSK